MAHPNEVQVEGGEIKRVVSLAFIGFRGTQEVVMKCQRCQGWMVEERYYGPGMPYWGFRCVSCGEILDPVIWENRKNFPGKALTKNLGASIGNSGRG